MFQQKQCVLLFFVMYFALWVGGELTAKAGELLGKALESEDTCSNDELLLLIGIPTVPRKNADYLSEVLDALAREVSTDPFGDDAIRIKILVMNNQPGKHEAFQKNRKRFGKDSRFVFMENQMRKLETPIEAHEVAREARRKRKEEGRTPRRPPSHKVQQQTRDVISLLRSASNTFHPAFYLFMEDDFVVCTDFHKTINSILRTAEQRYFPGWLAIRAGFGLNGIFVHGDDLKNLAGFLERHQARREPDHLTSEWFLGDDPIARTYKGDRVHAAFKFNLFHHIGTISTLRARSHNSQFPNCWERLKHPVILNRESFRDSDCHEITTTNLWPCSPLL